MRTFANAWIVIVVCLMSTRADEPRCYYGMTVDGWLAVLRDRTSTRDQHAQAVWALGGFGPEARAAVPDLIDAIRRGRSRDEAVDALVWMGEAPEVAVPRLIERYVKGCRVRRAEFGMYTDRPSVVNTLVRIGGPVVPALIEVLNGPNSDLRACAAATLGRIGPAARAAVPSLIRAIGNPDPDPEEVILDREALGALGRIGPEARAIVPVLNRWLRIALNGPPEKGGNRTFEVVKALAGIGVPPVGALLDRVLRDGDWFVAHQLAWLGPRARAAVPFLRGALADSRAQVRDSAAVALAHIEPTGREMLPILIEALKLRDNDTLNVSEVPRALARLGQGAGAALPALIDLVRSGCDDDTVFEALVKIDPEGRECVPALISALEHEDYSVVNKASHCLGLLGPRAKDAVPALLATLTRDFHEDYDFWTGPQVSAAKALRRIGPHAKPAIPALISALKYRRRRPGQPDYATDVSAATAAAELLGCFGAEAKAAVPALIEAARTTEKFPVNWFVRKSAILALGRMRPGAKAAVPILRGMLTVNGKDSDVLPELLVALSQLSPEGKQLAEQWLDQPPRSWMGWRMHKQMEERRGMVLGAIGRTSVEADCRIREELRDLDEYFAEFDADADDLDMEKELWFERLGRFGVGGRLAIPWLTGMRRRPSPWVRMWAAEALGQIRPPTGVRS